MLLYLNASNDKSKKGIGGDVRVVAELSYKNKIVGTIGLYAILGTDLKGNNVEGYRVVWSDPEKGWSPDGVLKEEEIKAKATGD